MIAMMMQKTPGRRQRGIALLVALVVLIVVTLLGTAAMRSALFQTRISSNAQGSQLLFQGAESGLEAINNYATAPGFRANPNNAFLNVVSGTYVRFCLQADGTSTPETVAQPLPWGNPASPANVAASFDNWCPGLLGAPSGTELVQVTAVMSLPPPEVARTLTLKPQEITASCTDSTASCVGVYTQSFARIPGFGATKAHVQMWALDAPADIN